MFRKKVDFDEEVERLARKSNFKMRRTEYSFDKTIEKLDTEIDIIMNDKIKEFDDNKKITQDYLHLSDDTLVIDRYREKLRKI